MAKMFPSKIPDYVAQDKGRSAEIRVYSLLASQLPEKYVCYYSRPWHRFKPDGKEQDGEADFVVAHPDFGMLVIEVKGGRVSCRDYDDQWLSKDRYDIEFKIKNPVTQARTSKHNLLNLLKNSNDWKSRFINVRHGVILPDNSRPQRALGADAPLELFAFGADLDHLGDWVEARLGTGDSGDGATGLGMDGMLALHKTLTSRFELRPHLARALSDDVRQIELLTAEQAWILDDLEENAQMSVCGAAGTGKTVLALEKALRTVREDKRTLLVCFNSALGTHLKKLTDSEANLVVASFHGLCGYLAKLAEIDVPDHSPENFFKTVLPEMLYSAVTKRPELRFDSIIVDEGQDFSDDWLNTLRLCLFDIEKSQFYVFFDDNQRIFSRENTFLDALPPARFRLSRNLRNTKAIHKSLLPWYEGKKTTAVGPAGEPVQWCECRNVQEVYAKASAIVAELVKTKQLRSDEIAILSGQSKGDCPLFQKNTLGGCEIIGAGEKAGERSIVGDTVRRFKGLEAKCVIVVDVDHLTEPELVYVALSRPAVLLYVLGNEHNLKRLKTGSTQ